MAAFIALIRGINVGGHKTVSMAAARELITGLGFANVRTLLNSGNVVFNGSRRTPAQVETLLEKELLKQLAVESHFFIRTAAEWEAIVAANPFPEAARLDPGHMVVMCLKKAPASSDVEALRQAIVGPETLRVEGRTAYLIYPAGMGTSKLTNAMIEKYLRTRGTARNWNTVMKLREIASG